jgi:Cu(I)/Ag(I) efflux system membrane fusion protein
MNEHEDQEQTVDRPALDVSVTGTGAVTSSRWDRAKFLFRAIEVRLRFVALFVGIGLLMVYWRTIENYWDRWTRPSTQAVAAETGSEFYCPMHPTVIRPGLEPNGAVPSCPICGMPLSKRNKGEVAALPEGVTARVQLSPERVKLAGIETVAASYMPLTKEIRTVGYVAYDESRLSEIVTRVSGYLETLYIDNTFVNVKEGDPLAEIYSPELYSSVQELLLAQKHGSKDLIASSRKRLKLLGISDTEIDDALAGSDDRRRLLIRSPQSGQVVEKNVVEGASVASGDTLFKIADLSEVWIEADVFERNLSFLHEGQHVEATVEAFPGTLFEGEISLIYPELNTETRTSRVRVSVKNSDLLLRPGMYATVLVKTPVSETEAFRAQLVSRQRPTGGSDEALIAFQKICPVTGAKLGSMGTPVKVQLGTQTVFLCCEGCEKPLQAEMAKYLERLAGPAEDAVLSIPEQAVIDTGRKQIVFVEREPGIFEGVEVELGPRTGGYYPVLQGLSPGDKVAAAGSFLLDAETRLNPAAASSYFGASGGPGSGEATASSESKSSRGGAAKTTTKKLSKSDLENIAKLPTEDRELAIAQAICPVTDEPLGSMGVPIKIMLQDRPVFLCCKGCVQQAQENPEDILKKIGPLKAKETRDEPNSDRSAAKQYDVTAKVVAIGVAQESVTLDHDDIPGLMPGMTMRFDVESPSVLKGIEPGDSVEGRLTVESDKYIITQLTAKSE